MTVRPGQVIRIFSEKAGKQKYHLCISTGNGFLFLNSPKPKPRPGDLVVPCADIPCLPATAEGTSIICCTTIVRLSTTELGHRKTKVMGDAAPGVLFRVFAEVEGAIYLTEEDREFILAGLEDWAF